MDLLEYQAKEIFQQMGIPVLPSQRIDHPKDLKKLKIPYPVVLKSQVRAGGRGKAGGIKFVGNTIDAVAAAQTIFHLAIMDEYPEVLLAEAKYNVEQEFYLAVVLDRAARRPVLLGSPQGGTSTESAMEQMQRVVVDREFSPFYARRLMLKMGLQGGLIQSVSAIVEKMYQLFVQYDLDLVEINPLGISPTGEVMALDGKVTANDDALCRHPELAKLTAKDAYCSQNDDQSLHQRLTLNLVKLDGNIGIICNGAGLTMATLDLVCAAGGKPASFLNLGGEGRWNATPEEFCDRLSAALDLIREHHKLSVILINLLGSVVSCDRAAATIEAYLKQKFSAVLPTTNINFVVRLVGNEWDAAQTRLAALEIPLTDRLDDAVAQAVSIAEKKN